MQLRDEDDPLCAEALNLLDDRLDHQRLLLSVKGVEVGDHGR
jgi:hypothetical protein